MFTLYKRFKGVRLNPPAILALGFIGLIFGGALLLTLPIATRSGEITPFIDSLFTSASAVCVTGLVVVNTAEYWSFFGQAVILILIQIGGLGVMTIATIIALISGKRISLKERLIIREQLNQETLAGLVKLMIAIILITFGIELLGAIILSFKFIPEHGIALGIWQSIFHSISAFCNAGFDITGNSLVPYYNSFLTVGTISVLIIIGGLGFSVLLDVFKKKCYGKLNIHTKLVLIITGALLFAGMVMFMLLEYNNPLTLGNMPFHEKLLSAFFASVVPRTAGFNSIDVTGMSQSSSFLTILLMFIGGSPASTAGGIKTATFGVIVLATVSIIKGKKDVEFDKKRIPIEVVLKALAIMTVALGLIIVVAFALTITEGKNFLDTLFEVTSAFGTVGLSRGLTPDLTTIGKLLISMTMYLGRVGPLTMAFAIGYWNQHKRFRYAEGQISVG